MLGFSIGQLGDPFGQSRIKKIDKSWKADWLVIIMSIVIRKPEKMHKTIESILSTYKGRKFYYGIVIFNNQFVIFQ